MIAALERERERQGAVGKAATRPRLDAARRLDAAAAVLRTNTPPGVDAVYVDAFVGRRRELAVVVRREIG